MVTRDVGAIVADPTWFPVDLDRDRSEIIFVKTSLETLVSQSFLTSNMWDTSGLDYCRVDLAKAVAYIGDTSPPPKLNFVWHTAYCGSTLLGLALNAGGRNLTLGEPVIFTKLGDLKRTGALDDPRTTRITTTILTLLARPFTNDASITIKAAPAANILAPHLAQFTVGKSLFLLSDCASFLSAIYRRGEAGANYARRLFRLIMRDNGNLQGNWPIDRLLKMSDLEVAAIAWHLEVAEFNRAMLCWGDSRAASLDCDSFIFSPASTLAKLDDMFGLGLSVDGVRSVVRGPLLRRDPKDASRAFGALQRRRAQQSVAWEVRREIEQVVAWSYEQCPQTPRRFPVPNPLMRPQPPETKWAISAPLSATISGSQS